MKKKNQFEIMLFSNDKIGTKRVFKMVSGGLAVCELTHSDRPSMVFEDTGQRKETWKILGYVEGKEDIQGIRWDFSWQNKKITVSKRDLMQLKTFSREPYEIDEILTEKFFN